MRKSPAGIKTKKQIEYVGKEKDKVKIHKEVVELTIQEQLAFFAEIVFDIYLESELIKKSNEHEQP
jgi:hypothetical protein